MSATPELITPYSGSNFIPYVVVNTPTGIAVEPKPFPIATVLAMTLVIGLIAAIIVFVTFKMDAAAELRGLMMVPVALGTFGPAVAIWFQARHHQKRGTLLRIDAAAKTIELPRESITFPAESLDRLALVSGRDSDITQLQLHTSDGKHRVLISTMDYDALHTIARRIAETASTMIEEFEGALCDDDEEHAT
jgi:hypothetical protein